MLELQANFGTIGIVAKPDDAILVDGENMGSGNYSGRLSPGIHKIVVSHEKYYPQQQEITIIKGQEKILNIQLMPIVGSLSVMVDPPETSIYLNSKYYGMSPKIIDSLLIGEYDLELKKEGFAIFRQHLVLEKNKTIQIDTALHQGKLIKVKSTPTGAEVYCNGSVVGTTPAEFFVKEGSNKLILKKKYFADKEVSITAEKDDQNLNFNLEIDRPFFNVSFETKPNKAEIYLYEKAFIPEFSSISTNSLRNYYGISPYNIQIPLGKYHLVVKKAGFLSIEKDILIDKQDSFIFNLER